MHYCVHFATTTDRLRLSPNHLILIMFHTFLNANTSPEHQREVRIYML